MNKIEQFIQTIQKSNPDLELRRDVPMAAHTTFRIGGAASLLAVPTTVEELTCCLNAARELDIRTEVIGRGSNLLVADQGIEALVVVTCGLSGMERTGKNEITAGAGIPLARLATFAAQQNLGGLTFAHGIPGSLGGAVTMNGGAYGGVMGDVVRHIRCLTPQGEQVVLSGEEAQFSYRHSIFCDRDLIITEVILSLPDGDCDTLMEEMKILAEKRRNSQPLEYPSGGSMFKRPEGYYAAALIDQCGLKGFTVGGAQVSEKHAGFVINRNHATCADVLELVRQVKDCVREKTGVLLEMEVKILQ